VKEIMSQAQIDADPAAWLEARRSLITATDMVGILSAADYTSPWKVYAEKTTGMQLEDTYAMFFGRHNESAIADLYAGRYPQVCARYLPEGHELHQAGLCVSDDHDWLGATFDRLEEPSGAVIEIKSWRTRDGFGTPPHGEIPLRMHIQCLVQAAVRGADLVKLVVAFDDRISVYWVVVDDNAREDIAYFIGRARAFREDHLLPRRPPPVDGRPVTAMALKSVHSAVEVETRAVVPKRLWTAALKARQRRDAAVEAYGLAVNRIAAMQGDAALSVTRDGDRVLQRSQSWPKRVDLKKLRAEYPEVAAACTVTSADPEIKFLLKDPKE
jgi:predicted phage-related endonuclease